MNLIMQTLTDLIRGVAIVTLILFTPSLVNAMIQTVKEKEGE
mgnify:CR=1 FL=1